MSTSTVEGPAAARRICVVAFTGRPGAGGATAAHILAAHCGCVPLAICEAARSEICALWGIAASLLTHRPTLTTPMPALAIGRSKDPAYVAWSYDAGHDMHLPRSPGWLLQHWASYRRRYRPSHFAAILAQQIRHHAALGRRDFTVADLRDPVDERALRHLGVRLQVVRVHSRRAWGTGADDVEPCLTADFELHNDTTLEALRDAVLALAQQCEFAA